MIAIFKYTIISMRPKQWVKNVFVFAGLLFSRQLFDVHLLMKVISGFCLFCLVSSGIYVFNDIRDIDKDKEHPKKRNRPLAAGQLKIKYAYGIFISLTVFGLIGAFILDLYFFAILCSYLILNITYSVKLKQIVILDVMCIAFGFVLRILAGTSLAAVTPSDWLIICTITLSLFLGFSKRRHELALIGSNAANHRKVLTDYSITFLDQMIAIATACTVMSYALYTVANETVVRFGTRNLVFTIPFVLYGIYRYLYLIHKREIGGNPTSAVFSDLPLLLNGILWLAVVIFIIY